jgi:hypothetical protein
MRYVQFQVSPALSELLTQRANEEDLVLAEIVMDALGAFTDRPASPTQRRRRRRSASAPVRRFALVSASEAEEVQKMAERFELTPSALIRAALENYLMS